jgi:hypothetical protein
LGAILAARPLRGRDVLARGGGDRRLVREGDQALKLHRRVIDTTS